MAAAVGPFCARWCSLLVIVIQNAALIVIACYSRRLPGPRYLGSVAVLLTELLKAAVVLSCGWCTLGRTFLPESGTLLRDRPRWVLTFSLPAMCYCIHNNLWYVAVTHLDPVTVAVGTQSKVIFAAVFAVLLLGRGLGAARWSAICLLAVGLMLVESSAPFWPRPSQAIPEPTADNSNGLRLADDVARSRGLLALAALCALSGLAGTLTEMLLKDPCISSSLWTRNLFMSLFSLPIAAAAVAVTDWDAVRSGRLLVGFGAWPAGIVCLGALGGVVTSVALRYADNLLKSFAVGISIVLAVLLASGLLGVRMSLRTAAGAALVAAASTAYYVADDGFGFGACGVDPAAAAAEEGRSLLQGHTGGRHAAEVEVEVGAASCSTSVRK
jgi:UDP-sugar transporter A1/2/3